MLVWLRWLLWCGWEGWTRLGERIRTTCADRPFASYECGSWDGRRREACIQSETECGVDKDGVSLRENGGGGRGPPGGVGGGGVDGSQTEGTVSFI